MLLSFALMGLSILTIALTPSINRSALQHPSS
jgi:hypothetical protein